MLIRIVFVFFIANGIDCLGGVCDNCCDCFKNKDENKEIEKYEEIKGKGNITAKSLVNDNWYNAQKENLVLKVFKKKDDNDSQGNGDKISIELDKNNNPKMTYQKEAEDEPNLGGKKYALFEIEIQDNKTVYLYCSDVESNENNYLFNNGIFESTNHKSISVIACDTENVRDMTKMFYGCSNLTKLNLKNFNTTNVENMIGMFSNCNRLKELDLQNFNTTKVTNMLHMFYGCSYLTKLDLSKFNTDNVTNMASMFHGCMNLENLNLNNFNTKKVTNMEGMFSRCSGLENLNLNNFNTENVTDMSYMFYGCSMLTDLKFGQNFNTRNKPRVEDMFFGCNSFPNNIQDKNVEEIIDYFKKKQIKDF